MYYPQSTANRSHPLAANRGPHHSAAGEKRTLPTWNLSTDERDDGGRNAGGHISEFALTRGRVSAQTFTSLQVDLSNNDDFAQAELSSVPAGTVDQLEKHRH
ncbi:MAG: acetolactate decarboxylase [Mycobacterium sp.]